MKFSCASCVRILTFIVLIILSVALLVRALTALLEVCVALILAAIAGTFFFPGGIRRSWIKIRHEIACIAKELYTVLCPDGTTPKNTNGSSQSQP